MLSHALHRTRIHKVSSGDFVRFQLIPIGMDCCPSWFKTKEFPPEDEVQKGRYIYEPVPVDNVELANIPLPHLLKPGPHTDKFRITMFPKKIRDQLVRQPGHSGQRVIGWAFVSMRVSTGPSFYC
ncbi:uncharacterized protein ASPGLDRAFT_1346818 [Aspergillus glaucus CBS 516.65]|uniref:Uncharacterized protein n=1 Tax=Aspergillus glaucus CBS 516.65 TaxID=1160497 RepID=A0A1L9VNE0_ASPGL|nr:hypothetical protein ASPGLDRAFT_1346818 [Aspergillus glaucus CBS 516.65]OJJ85391.1 hypothetical protein ASPGLDRAFT_1346818 [Aspergillus glaucus CBS 516.65]